MKRAIPEPPATAAGHGEEPVEMSETVQTCPKSGDRGVLISKVGLGEPAPDFGRQRLALIRIDRNHENRCSFGCEASGTGRGYPGGASDKNRLVLQSHDQTVMARLLTAGPESQILVAFGDRDAVIGRRLVNPQGQEPGTKCEEGARPLVGGRVGYVLRCDSSGVDQPE